MSNVVASTFGNFTEEELKVLKNGIKELSDVYTMMEAQKDTEKSIIDAVYEELKIPKSLIRKVAKAYHKRNYDAVVAENEEFQLFYEGVVKDQQNP